MEPFNLSAEFIAAVTGVLTSVLFSYFPGLRTKFAALSTEAKSGIMLGLMALVTASLTVLDWFDVVDAGLAFDKAGIVHIVWTFLLAVIANQATHRISPAKIDVIEAKADR